jgi:hypothetical protein
MVFPIGTGRSRFALLAEEWPWRTPARFHWNSSLLCRKARVAASDIDRLDVIGDAGFLELDRDFLPFGVGQKYRSIMLSLRCGLVTVFVAPT